MFFVACAVESVPVSSQTEEAVSTPAATTEVTLDPSPGGPTTNDIACIRRCLASCGTEDYCVESCRCLCSEPEYCN